MGQLPPLFQGTQMMWQEQLGPAKAMGVCPIEQPKAKACRLLPGLWWGRFPSGFLPALLKPCPLKGHTKCLLSVKRNTSTWPAQTSGAGPQHLPSPEPSHMAPGQLTLKELLPSFTSAKLGWGLQTGWRKGYGSLHLGSLHLRFGKFLAPPSHTVCSTYIGGKLGVSLSSPDLSHSELGKEQCGKDLLSTRGHTYTHTHPSHHLW